MHDTTQASVYSASMVIGGVFLEELKGALYDLRWMEMFLILLIVADLYYGLMDNIGLRHESFHFNLCGRRTSTKFIEYNTYLIFGMVLGMAVLEPSGICTHIMGALGGLCLAIFFEIDSIFTHYCRIKGIRPRFSPKMLFVNYFKRKASELTNVITTSEDNEDRTQKDVQQESER